MRGYICVVICNDRGYDMARVELIGASRCLISQPSSALDCDEMIARFRVCITSQIDMLNDFVGMAYFDVTWSVVRREKV